MSSKQKNWGVLLIVVAVVMLYTLSGGSVGICLNFEDEALAVSASDYDWTIPYDRIEALELVSLPDTGNMLDGVSRRNLRCGTWENEVWGEYTLCIRPDIDRCIVMTQKDGEVFVFNYESSSTTESLAEMISELLASKDYWNDPS